jgi:hypothetical protein
VPTEIRIHLLARFGGESGGPFPAQDFVSVVRFLFEQLDPGPEDIDLTRNFQTTFEHVYAAFILFLDH